MQCPWRTSWLDYWLVGWFTTWHTSHFLGLIYYLVLHLSHQLNLDPPLGLSLVLHLGSWFDALDILVHYLTNTLFLPWFFVPNMDLGSWFLVHLLVPILAPRFVLRMVFHLEHHILVFLLAWFITWFVTWLTNSTLVHHLAHAWFFTLVLG